MQHSIWGYFIIVVGVVGISLLLLFQDVTTTNDQNYYLTKEITEAAMLDAFDEVYYAISGGKVAIDKEKFTESFIRRYAESTGLGKEITIKIYDVVEYPPKVSLTVGSKSTPLTFTGEQFNIVNKIDAILETRY